MRKLTILFCLTLFSLLSCEKENELSNEPIIGLWTWNQLFLNDSELILDECNLLRSINFRSGGSFTEEIFNNFNDTCEFAVTYNGIWTKLENDNYLLDYSSSVDDLQDFIIELDPDNNIFFYEEIENGNIYRIIYKRN